MVSDGTPGVRWSMHSILRRRLSARCKLHGRPSTTRYSMSARRPTTIPSKKLPNWLRKFFPAVTYRLERKERTIEATVSHSIRSRRSCRALHVPGMLARGAQQLRQIFDQIDMTPEVFTGRSFTRLKQLEYLIRTNQIDQDFFWRPDASAAPVSA